MWKQFFAGIYPSLDRTSDEVEAENMSHRLEVVMEADNVGRQQSKLHMKYTMHYP
jgi:hypothetical protein